MSDLLNVFTLFSSTCLLEYFKVNLDTNLYEGKIKMCVRKRRNALN